MNAISGPCVGLANNGRSVFQSFQPEPAGAVNCRHSEQHQFAGRVLAPLHKQLFRSETAPGPVGARDDWIGFSRQLATPVTVDTARAEIDDSERSRLNTSKKGCQAFIFF